MIESGGHMGRIKDIMFSPDGTLLYSISFDKTVRVWDVATGVMVRMLRGQINQGREGMLNAAALSPDGRTLAVGGWLSPPKNHARTGIIRLLDPRTGAVKALLRGHSKVIQSLAFSPNGRWLLSGSNDKTARLWDVASGQTRAVLRGHKSDIRTVSFSPDGRRAVTGEVLGTLILWRIPEMEQIAKLGGHKYGTYTAAFTPDGRWLLSGGFDNTIRLWDGRTGKFIKVLARQKGPVNELSISPNGRWVLIGTVGMTLENNVFRIPSGEKVTAFTRHRGNIAVATAFSPDGRLAATGGGFDHEIYLWDPTTGEVRHRLFGQGRGRLSVGFSRDGSAIAWGTTHQTRKTGLRLSGKSGFTGFPPLEKSFRLRDESGRADPALGEAVRGQGSWGQGIQEARGVRLESQGNSLPDRTIHILRSGRVAHRITRKNLPVFYIHNSLTLTPDGRIAISGGNLGFLASFDTATGRELHEFEGHTGNITSVAPSPDGRWLVSSVVTWN